VEDDTDCDDTGVRAHLIHPGADYQAAGHCGGGSTCTNLAGAPGCEVCTGSPPTQICSCSGPDDFDYDCDGVVEIEDSGASCNWVFDPTLPGGGYCSGATWTTAVGPSDCGSEQPFASCSGLSASSCSPGASEGRTVRCR
jgi:hypothetical protein